MAVHGLSSNAVMVPTHSEVMKESCVVAPCAFDNGASYYKETLHEFPSLVKLRHLRD